MDMARLSRIQRLTFLLAPLMLTACAVSAEKAAESLAEEERVVCTREVPTGGMGMKTMCRTVADMRLQRAAVLQQMDQVRTEGTKN